MSKDKRATPRDAGTLDASDGSGGHGAGAAAEFSQAELGELLAIGIDWLWETDAEHRFTRIATPDGRDAEGAEASIGQPRLGFIRRTPRGGTDVETHVADIEARRPFRNFVFEMPDPCDGCRWVSNSGFPRFAPDGTFLGYRWTAPTGRTGCCCSRRSIPWTWVSCCSMPTSTSRS